MTPQERINLIDMLAKKEAEGQPLENLVEFYYLDQFEYYDSLSEEDLLKEFEVRRNLSIWLY